MAATALIVLTTGFSDENGALVSRLVDTAIGIATGLVVNLRNILEAMEEVAAANPMSQPPLPFRRG